jgi:hypothetical protein
MVVSNKKVSTLSYTDAPESNFKALLKDSIPIEITACRTEGAQILEWHTKSAISTIDPRQEVDVVLIVRT